MFFYGDHAILLCSKTRLLESWKSLCWCISTEKISYTVCFINCQAQIFPTNVKDTSLLQAILPSPKAAGAVAETTSTTSPEPARVIQGSERPTVDENEIIHPVHS
jgi:hypothetical protein